MSDGPRVFMLHREAGALRTMGAMLVLYEEGTGRVVIDVSAEWVARMLHAGGVEDITPGLSAREAWHVHQTSAPAPGSRQSLGLRLVE